MDPLRRRLLEGQQGVFSPSKLGRGEMWALKCAGGARQSQDFPPPLLLLCTPLNLSLSLVTHAGTAGEGSSRCKIKIRGSVSAQSVTFKRPPWPGPPFATAHAPTAIGRWGEQGERERHLGGGRGKHLTTRRGEKGGGIGTKGRVVETAHAQQ